ncbi:recombinase family protein [Parasaccharibacter sp. TMW 2.1884]|uniref:recombinase family protein n=1 Tax=Parasaccharibacter sp. TMW 2.1884 TaxID=2267834 RepID=UPI0020132BD0|nr:recombinase family protein [Parasaccharibacter sp. TMW 2.1884]MCL1512565.1 recombinase family protein [Parasaccharibacter sp. TMW 2.1884]
MKYGYARVSTVDQNIGPQVETLLAAGCDLVRQEVMSGTKKEGRVELQLLLDFIRPGDVLVVTRIDRLARSIADLSSIISCLEKKGASLLVTEQGLDTGTSQGRMMAGLLGVIAEFENDLRRERQAEGIAAARKAGRFRGRPANREREERVLALKAQGLSLGRIAAEVGMSRSGVNRIVQKQGELQFL